MKATSEVEVTVKLEMTLREARWLQNVMQNPLYGDSPTDEAQIDMEMRHKFFTAVKSQTDNHA